MLLGWIRRFLLQPRPQDKDLARMGFSDGPARAKLERAIDTFFTGYQTALEETDPDKLAGWLDRAEAEVVGFAYEGAAMALAIMDQMTPWRSDLWERFLAGPGGAHAEMLYAGAGFGLARVPWVRTRIEQTIAGMDPLMRWVVIDGYGCHEGFYKWQLFLEGRIVAEHLSPYGRRVFDHGLGRSLWLGAGGNAVQVAETITAYPPDRQADLWSGVGLASTYAGAVDRQAVEAVARVVGPYGPQAAQGSAFAARFRLRGGNPCAHTEAACRVLCGMSAEEAACLVDRAMENLPADGDEPAYEIWRRRIQAYFGGSQ